MFSNATGQSVRHLNRLYRNLSGESLGVAIGRARLDRARALLHERADLPVEAVASECGFCSPARDAKTLILLRLRSIQ